MANSVAALFKSLKESEPLACQPGCLCELHEVIDGRDANPQPCETCRGRKKIIDGVPYCISEPCPSYSVPNPAGPCE